MALASSNVTTAEVVLWNVRVRESSLELEPPHIKSVVVEPLLLLLVEVEIPDVEDSPALLLLLASSSIFSLSQLTANCHFSDSSKSLSLTLVDLLADCTKILIHWYARQLSLV